MTDQQWEVNLPDGRTISVSNDPSTWPQVGQTGFVPEHAVAPDPRQPRNTANITDSEAHTDFTASMLQHGQGMIMQVRPLSDEQRAELPQAFERAHYLIVDGERRFHAAGRNGANLGVYEVTVREYEEEKTVFVQQVVLNTLQKPLNSPDLARAIVRIQADYGGISVSEVARMINVNQVKANDHWHIAHLPADLLELTNQTLYKKGQRFSIKPAVALAKIGPEGDESAHDRQRRLYAEMCELGIKNATAQVAFLEEFHSPEVRAHSDKREPRRKRNRIKNFIHSIQGNDLLAMSIDEVQHTLSTATPQERLDILRELEETQEKLKTLTHRVRAAHQKLAREVQRNDEQKRATPIKRTMAQPKKGQPVAARKVVSPPEIKTPDLSHVPDTGIRPYATGPSSETRQQPGPVTAKHLVGSEQAAADKLVAWRSRVNEHFPLETQHRHGYGRMASAQVKTPQKFMEIYKAGDFKHQVEGGDYPSFWPSLELIEGLIKEYEQL